MKQAKKIKSLEKDYTPRITKRKKHTKKLRTKTRRCINRNQGQKTTNRRLQKQRVGVKIIGH